MPTIVKQTSAGTALLLVVLAMLINLPVRAATAMVWSQDDEPDMNVYYSPDGERIVQITTDGINIAPNLFRAKSMTWLTWIDRSSHASHQLKFAKLSALGSILETGSVATINRSVYAPAISIDSEQRRVWLVWTEYNGRTETLYASYRDIRSKLLTDWQPPLQITPDGAYSASVPIIEASEFDRAQVSWVRTSPTSSESASITILADNWLSLDTATVGNGTPGSRQAQIKILPRGGYHNRDIFAKTLRKGQPRSADEQQWETLTQGTKMRMGATHSGTGPSRRLTINVK